MSYFKERKHFYNFICDSKVMLCTGNYVKQKHFASKYISCLPFSYTSLSLFLTFANFFAPMCNLYLLQYAPEVVTMAGRSSHQ